MDSKRKNIINYFVMFLLIANSGFPFFTNQALLLLGSFCFCLIVAPTQKILKFKALWSIAAILVILVIGQYFSTGVLNIRTFFTLFVRWLFPLFVVYIVGESFFEIYIKWIYILTIIAMTLFIPSMLIPGFENFLLHNIAPFFAQQSKTEFYEYNNNILIYTIKPVMAMDSIWFKRNSGPFWEPGAYGTFLVLAFMINTIKTKKLFDKRNVLFTIAILTTWSTTSLFALMVFVFFYGTFILERKMISLFIMLAIPLVAMWSYTELKFVRDRIDRTSRYYNEREDIDNERRDRMVSAIVDIRTFVHHPLFGTGRAPEARFGHKEKTYLEHRNNGLTDFLVKYGLPFFIFYFLCFYKTFLWLMNLYQMDRKKKKVASLMMCIIGILGFSQGLFQLSFFIAIFFYSFIKHFKYNVSSNSYTNF